MELFSYCVFLALLATRHATAEDGNSTEIIDVDSNKLFARRPYCQAPRAVNGQCGEYYSGTQCGGSKLGQVAPGCTGECFSVSRSFWSVKATGDGNYGTNCALYSDSNRQKEFRSTGNAVTVTNRRCATGQGVAHSLRCYFNC